MTTYFPEVSSPIQYEGPDSKNPLAFKQYNADEVILGKTMRDHLRFSVCYWHSFKGAGNDPFGVGTRQMPWEDAGTPLKAAEQTLDAAFEFITKLGVDYYCFHDRDIAPETGTLPESNKALDHIIDLAAKKQEETGIKLLWGTACLFSHPRYMTGAATGVSADVFAYAGAQVKKAMEVTHKLNGEGYVFWGGREGYDSLLNTNLSRELDHLGAFLHLAVDYKKAIGFKGEFYIEPKPKEPTKHQYDSDAAACHAFLQKYGLVDHLKLNIEANHATLAGHSFHHELEYAASNNMLGSIDANRGDTLLGWDTDQFPTDLYDTTMAMYTLIKHGGFTTGGMNFDAKVRRQSTETVDLFHAHIGGMDAFARGLRTAAKLWEDKALENVISERYAGWETDLGKKIEAGGLTLEDLEKHALAADEPTPPSGRQELVENILNDYL